MWNAYPFPIRFLVDFPVSICRQQSWISPLWILWKRAEIERLWIDDRSLPWAYPRQKEGPICPLINSELSTFLSAGAACSPSSYLSILANRTGKLSRRNFWVSLVSTLLTLLLVIERTKQLLERGIQLFAFFLFIVTHYVGCSDTMKSV